jgi:DegV family protein with EDD domain
MPGVTILTDSTAQFTSEDFPGRAAVNIIPLHLQLNKGNRIEADRVDLSELPASIRSGNSLLILPPSTTEFHERYLSLGRDSDEVITLLHSAQLSPACDHAEQAARGLRGRMALPVIDSQTTGVGLGLLVQAASEAAQAGTPPGQILEQLRRQSRRIYSIFCLQSLSYLAAGGHLDPIQALVGEMLAITPLVLLENGRLVTIQKARSPRQLGDLLVEFIAEFENLQHIALVRGRITYEISSLRERIQALFPQIPFSEHSLLSGLGAMLGPRSLGLVAMEASPPASRVKGKA